MDTSSNNPPGNNLRAGFTEEQLAEAVRKSGYPLQTIVADQLRGKYFVQQEWSFVDSDEGKLRTLDVSAQLPLYDATKNEHPRVRPTLNLLIECKQSDLPYVFFLSQDKPWAKNFPIVAGLFHDYIEVTTNDNPSTWKLPIINTLDLDRDTFIKNDVDYCFTFSKCTRKGSNVEVPPDVELSGSESFRGLVLPLVKALGHFYKQEKPPATAMYFDAHLVFAVAVVDAPMIAVTIDEGKQKLTAVPWVRILRNESMDSDDWTERSKRYAIDVVHKDFLQPFLKNHLEPYAAKFGELALKHQLEIASGKAFAENMWHGHIAPLESRLKPRMTTHAVRRPMQILSHAIRQIGRLIMGKKLH